MKSGECSEPEDDILDDADKRRGEATVVQWGFEDVAMA